MIPSFSGTHHDKKDCFYTYTTTSERTDIFMQNNNTFFFFLMLPLHVASAIGQRRTFILPPPHAISTPQYRLFSYHPARCIYPTLAERQMPMSPYWRKTNEERLNLNWRNQERRRWLITQLIVCLVKWPPSFPEFILFLFFSFLVWK